MEKKLAKVNDLNQTSEALRHKVKNEKLLYFLNF